MEIKKFRNTDQIAEELSQLILGLASENKSHRIDIALSGGNTPKMIFNYLAGKYGTKLANPFIHFWWVDERCVPPTHPDSNFKWAYELWLQPIGVPHGNIHRIIGENEPQHEAIRYAAEINGIVRQHNGIPCFDLIVLGLGDDGHTASIFPNQMQLLTSDNWCEVATHPASGQQRITITGKVLNNARQVVFITTGADKAKIVKEVIVDRNMDYPASNINPINDKLTWYLDEAAAKYL